MARDYAPDVELTGTMIGPRGGTWHFVPDFLPEPIFIPKSQCTIIEREGDTCTISIRGWLARKEGWIV